MHNPSRCEGPPQCHPLFQPIARRFELPLPNSELTQSNQALTYAIEIAEFAEKCQPLFKLCSSRSQVVFVVNLTKCRKHMSLPKLVVKLLIKYQTLR